MTLAKAFVTGTIVKAQKKRFTQNDMAISGFTINIDKTNETLLRVVAFGQLADTVSSTLVTGDSVAVEGKLQVNTYKLPDGKDKKVYEINANFVEKISNSNDNNTTLANNQSQTEIVSFNQDEVAQDLIDEDEIPF